MPYERLQAHRPLLEQTEAVGHAVRAVYLYSGLADLAAETGDRRYRRTLDRLWESVALRKLYLTGGIGALAVGEQFSGDYHLPNETAYAETCASIGLIFWARRLLDLDCDRRYAEVMEAALYNGALSGVSLDGRRFFYVNPLASEGRHHRQEFFGCACCPPNLLRLLASLGRYFYSAAEDELCVHLYGAGAARLEISGVRLRFVQETDYPWEGRVGLEISPERPVRFRLRLRVPEWCRNWSLSINGTSLSGRLSRGYLLLDRTWRPGDRLALDLEMKPELVHAHPAVGTAAGCAALRRGPLVYCLEGVDNPGLPSIFIDSARSFRPVRVESGPLKGLVLLKGRGWRASRAGWEKRLYSDRAPKLEPAPVIAVPYFVWDNRAAGPMRVWLPRPPAGS
ncbi:MAG: Non-reducing end beta-L-arabinofuranosidase [candidate division TA06 bacterium ADurb.Bin417]|uniref:Non-reducing end beta-L-arabinofuranosidase n=1 Tax=candidate division TA06 bacterium ADurb.Bin417 TaxID=1852828 RepID=A0A1V5MH80_UNCT6|nr:MAG: Non-reducing end beta-L-arabinofuranosidase [candidate division TA06 bacterium ADurb.Bin417]